MDGVQLSEQVHNKHGSGVNANKKKAGFMMTSVTEYKVDLLDHL